ncbi:MAG: SRPBCC family protein [Conexibacter sp.]
MPALALDIRCPNDDADAMFAILSDFEGHPARALGVRYVETGTDPDGRRTSSWEVDFHDGILVWSEWDEVDAEHRTIRFARRGGDPAEFEGAWTIAAEEQGCRIRFRATFDLGVATFASVLNPIALRALRDSMVALAASVADGDIDVVREQFDA